MLIVTALVVCCSFIFWIYYRIVNRKYYKLIENFVSIGGRWGYPLIGHVLLFIWKSPNDKIAVLCAYAFKTQRTVKLWVFSKLVIVLNTPKDIQTVLSSPHCLEKGTPYQVLTGTGSGLITATPSKWKAHRRLLNSPFTVQNIIKFIPTINEISRKMVQDLIPYCDRDEISLIDKIGYRIMDVAIQVLLDYSFDKQTLVRCFRDVEESLGLMGKRLVKFYSTIIVMFVEKLLCIVPRDQKLLYGLHNMLEAAFVAGKQNYMKEIEEDAEKIKTDDELRNCRDVFLKRLYRMKFHNRITEAELEENIGQFLVAGTDTSITAIGNICLCLAAHPHVQDKIYDELKMIMADCDDLDWDTMVKLEYLDRAIKESLRILPIIPIIIRKANKNIQLEDGIIPAGTDVLIPIANLHKRESIWGPNVNQFDPDNFLPENCQKRNPCSFIPFSYGPRNCIGYKYSMISLRIIFAHLIKNFKITTNLKLNELNFEYGISVKPDTGYKVLLSRR